VSGLLFGSATENAALIRRGDLSSVELLTLQLERIEPGWTGSSVAVVAMAMLGAGAGYTLTMAGDSPPSPHTLQGRARSRCKTAVLAQGVEDLTCSRSTRKEWQ
jgi:hypothetical protein